MTDATKIQAPWDAPPPAPEQAVLRDKSLAKLREKFPPAAVGKLPRATSKDARPGKCNVCGGWHKLPAIHLDYVGHAEVTDRLLSVDPYWDWAPLSFDEKGMPLFIRSGNGNPVGLWIKLTVCGVTRLGYGSVDGGAFDAEKQLIGDALRNAAMRFGVALDLWSKNELESNIEQPTAVEEAAADPVWDKKEHALESDSRSSSPRIATHRPTRTVQGVPITADESWNLIKTLQIKGKGPYSKMTWSEVDTQPDPSPFMDWLEKGVAEIMLAHKRALDDGRKNIPLPAAQRALLAWQRLLDRRAGLTEDEDDGTCPLTEEEMSDADERAGA